MLAGEVEVVQPRAFVAGDGSELSPAGTSIGTLEKWIRRPMFEVGENTAVVVSRGVHRRPPDSRRTSALSAGCSDEALQVKDWTGSLFFSRYEIQFWRIGVYCRRLNPELRIVSRLARAIARKRCYSLRRLFVICLRYYVRDTNRALSAFLRTTNRL